VHDDIIVHAHAVDQCERDALAHAVDFDDCGVRLGKRDDARGNREAHG
jgi:hypothetical protein